MENTQRRLEMEFPYYNYFLAIAKLIVVLNALHASKSRANVMVAMKDTF